MLNGRTAVITGASRGIGSAIAVKLAENGANVALLYKSNTEKAEEIKKACEGFGIKAMIYRCDVAKSEDCTGAVAEITKDGDYSMQSTVFDAKSEMLNLGYFDDKDATYKVYVKSLGFETADGIVEIPVGVELDPTSSTKNGLENGWKGAEIGTLIYGTEDCGIFAAETTIDWIGYRLALKVNGEEVPFTSVTYNVTISGLTFE